MLATLSEGRMVNIVEKVALSVPIADLCHIYISIRVAAVVLHLEKVIGFLTAFATSFHVF